VDAASHNKKLFLNFITTASVLAFLLLIAYPSYEYAHEELVITLPTLGISSAWRAGAMPVGIILMLIAAVLNVTKMTDKGMLMKAIGIFALTLGVFYALQPLFMKIGNWNLLVFFVGVVFSLVLLGVPIAVAFGLATVGYLTLSTTIPIGIVVSRMEEGMSHLILLAVPLFVFLGYVLEITSMAKMMVQFLATLLGHVRGGLSYVLVAAMYLVSGISGSKAADMAAVAPVLFPEMRKRGADDGELVALLAATGAQTETIPPSIVLITIGSVCGVSIAALFTGGLLPGLVCGVALCGVIWWRERKSATLTQEKASGREIWRTFLIASPALALPFVIRFAVVEGIATATEVSTIGVVFSLLVGAFFYKECNPQRLWRALIDTAVLSAAILFIIGTASAMAWALTQSGFSTQLAKAMAGIPGGAVGFMIVSILAFIALGSLLEGIPAIVVFGPLLFPIAKTFGINEVHYSMVVVLSMGIGLFAPPFGIGYYTACAIARVPAQAGIKPIVGYMVALLIGIIVVAAVPWLSIGFL
jgi:tripartite ATP-independent transporter DctM subunit